MEVCVCVKRKRRNEIEREVVFVFTQVYFRKMDVGPAKQPDYLLCRLQCSLVAGDASFNWPLTVSGYSANCLGRGCRWRLMERVVQF